MPSDGCGHNELYQLTQMLVEANNICTQLNKHIVCHFLMLLPLNSHSALGYLAYRLLTLTVVL